MSRRIQFAVAVQVAIMVAVLVPPLAVKYTGTPIWLETEKMDPRALFRGDYVILGYTVGQGIVPSDMAREARETGKPIYVTLTADRPARFVAASLDRPSLEQGQACLVGRLRVFGRTGGSSDTVDFPQIAQFFVPEGTGRVIESQRGEDLLARVAASRGCNGVLLGLEPR